MTRLVLYTRPGCHLCQAALAVLEHVRATVPFELEQRDIERDDELLRAYLERIPVLEHEGVVWFELDELDEPGLRRRLGTVGPR